MKKHRQQYLKEWRAKQVRAISRQWTPSSSPPSDDRIVLIALEGRGKDRVWLGWHDADGWYLLEGDAVNVSDWMERPKPPRATR